MAEVILFVRAPVAGRTKTRLARTLGASGAAQLYRHVAGGIVRRLTNGPWRLVLAVAPDAGVGDRWLRGFGAELRAQGPGDLGRRMARALRCAAPGPVLIVGSDVAGLGPAHLRAAFRALKTAPAVIGPAADGGYWLIGFARRRPLHGLFAGVRWSGPHARADTRATLPRGLGVAELATLRDLDDAEDLAALGGAAALTRRVPPR